jgi:hypothetical protein
MLSRIGFYPTVRDPLLYNEEKVRQDKARCIGAENFLKEHDQLTLEEKLDRFEQRASLNDIVVKKAVHISLNFGATEDISDDRLVILARKYMNEMGFEDQPWLAYRHTDAGHTHIHIVATDIQADGSKIRIRPPHFAKSRAITNQLEEEFSLQRKISAKPADQEKYAVTQAQKVAYGEQSLKHSLSNVLNTVIPHYQYTNLDELNAVLRLYNVTANPGEEHSRLRQLNGLLYHALDESGKRIGIPLKASSFLLKPTLKKLEQRFAANQTHREAAAETLRTTIDWTLAGELPDWNKLKTDLDQNGVTLVMSRPVNDSKDHLYFIDHNTKTVFDANILGKQYDLQSLQERCSPNRQTGQQEETHIHQIKLRL